MYVLKELDISGASVNNKALKLVDRNIVKSPQEC